MPCPATLLLRRIEYDQGPKAEAYGYGTVRLLGAGSPRSSGVVGGRDPFGRRRVNVEPVPGVLWALIWPPWDSAIWRAMDSPRPAPPSEREGSALWKRSKTRGNWSSEIPTPVSETASATPPSYSSTLTVTLPPLGVYLTALSRRMEATCSTRPRSKVAVISCSVGTNSTDTLPLGCGLGRLLRDRTEVVTPYLHGRALIPASKRK